MDVGDDDDGGDGGDVDVHVKVELLKMIFVCISANIVFLIF